MKMIIKEFLKPTKWKIIIALILVLLSFYNSMTNLAVACPEVVGADCSQEIADARNAAIIGNLIGIIPWYLFSCIIITIYKKIKKK